MMSFWRTTAWAVCLAVSAASASAAGLRIGAAAVKITPPTGTPMAGYYGERGSAGVLDDLFAKAAVLDDGKTEAAMVVCDVIGMPRGVIVEARKIIERKAGISADRVMISATHTHTGPMVIGGTTIEDLVAGESKLSRAYAEQLPQWIAQAVIEAKSRLAPVAVSYASETEPGMSFIRRFWMKDGTVGWNPGKLNPKIVRPIGEIDPQVNVFYAESADKKPVVTYVNFAIHLDTTGGDKISADLPATLAARLADFTGPEMLAMFGNGACGNVNHLNVKWAAPQGGPQEAKRLGTILAGDVLKAYMHLKSVEDATLRTRCEVVRLPLAKHTDEELKWARAIVGDCGGKKALFLDQVKAYRILDVDARRGEPFDVDVQVFSIGRDVAWVALPGEVFVELGMSIKAASPFPQTNVIELSNGRDQYIPNRSAFAEGQYEVISSRYDEGAGELLVATAIRLMEEICKAQ